MNTDRLHEFAEHFSVMQRDTRIDDLLLHLVTVAPESFLVRPGVRGRAVAGLIGRESLGECSAAAEWFGLRYYDAYNLFRNGTEETAGYYADRIYQFLKDRSRCR